MKTTKLVIGILSIVFSLFFIFQSFMDELGNILLRDDEVSGIIGFIVALLMLTAGIIVIVTRNQEKETGTAIAAIIYLFAFLVCVLNYGNYTDLRFLSIFCNIFWIILAASIMPNMILKVLFAVVFVALMIFSISFATNSTKNSEEKKRENKDLLNLQSASAEAESLYKNNHYTEDDEKAVKDGDILWYNPQTGQMLKTRTICGVGTDEIGLGSEYYTNETNRKYHYDGSSTVGKGIKVTFNHLQKGDNDIEKADIDIRFE